MKFKKKKLRHFEEEYLTTKLNDTLYVFKYSQRGSKINGRMKECSTYIISRWLRLKFVKISQKNNEIKQ